MTASGSDEQISPDPTQWLRTTLAGTLAGRNFEAALVRAQAAALREAADFYKRRLGTVGAFDIPLSPSGIAPWLRARADAIEAGQ